MSGATEPRKVAVITGAGQGIGRATARLLAADGYEVVVIDRDPGRADAVAAEVGGRAVVLDIADRAAVEAAAAAIGEIDALVNNAGIWRFAPLLEADAVDIEEVLAVNLLGTLWCTRAFADGLAARGGAVVNLSSLAAHMRASGVGIYSVSKAAVEALTQQVARELGPRGIRVNCVGPGLVRTEGTAANYEGEAHRRRGESVPLGRVGEPDEIAATIAWLVSPAASYISGQIIYADGALGSGSPSK